MKKEQKERIAKNEAKLVKENEELDKRIEADIAGKSAADDPGPPPYTEVEGEDGYLDGDGTFHPGKPPL